jgi:hypothetical protein
MEHIIGQTYEKSNVERDLNSLNSNKSVEFGKQSSTFRTAYNSIWNQLPYDTRTLLEGGISAALLGQSLNDKGLALKKGLDFMKSLGGFTSGNSSFGYKNNIFDVDDFPF